MKIACRIDDTSISTIIQNAKYLKKSTIINLQCIFINNK